MVSEKLEHILANSERFRWKNMLNTSKLTFLIIVRDRERLQLDTNFKILKVESSVQLHFPPNKEQCPLYIPSDS